MHGSCILWQGSCKQRQQCWAAPNSMCPCAAVEATIIIPGNELPCCCPPLPAWRPECCDRPAVLVLLLYPIKLAARSKADVST
jgi:hypothetical protein